MKRQLKVIDLFAGLGGNSEGATQAGAQVVFAANHNPLAVQFHKANHPDAAHLCQDLQQARWSQVPQHDLLIASPACTDHSNAKGKKRNAAREDDTRSTAYAVLGAADHHRPPFIIVENVAEFLNWDGYRGWKMTLQDFGYAVHENLHNAQEFGVPQSRERVFISAVRGKTPLVLTSPKLKPIAADTILDWDSGDWNFIEGAGLVENTMKRILAGREAHGDRYLVAYYGSEKGGRSIHKPIGTIRTNDCFMLIDRGRYRMLSVEETRRAMAFPEHYKLPWQKTHAKMMLGNAVPPPMMKHFVSQVRAVA